MLMTSVIMNLRPRPIIKNIVQMNAVELLQIDALWKNTMRRKQLEMVHLEHANVGIG